MSGMVFGKKEYELKYIMFEHYVSPGVLGQWTLIIHVIGTNGLEKTCGTCFGLTL